MENLTPITRKETFLAKAAGQDVETPTPVTREEVFLDAIAKGGGGGLPAVTSADNGKVLGVVDGAWATQSNLFVVNVTLNAQYVNVADKTFSEISAAIDAGKEVVCIRNNTIYILASKLSSTIYFADFRAGANSMHYVGITSTNAVVVTTQYQLSTVAASDNGSEMIVRNGAWAMQKKKFIVTLTPTSPDYSGTMDKTVAEINAAYEAGQEIVFRLITGADTYMDVAVTATLNGNATYPSYNAYIVDNIHDILIFGFTGSTNDGTKQTSSTTLYSLTPAS